MNSPKPEAPQTAPPTTKVARVTAITRTGIITVKLPDDNENGQHARATHGISCNDIEPEAEAHAGAVKTKPNCSPKSKS